MRKLQSWEFPFIIQSMIVKQRTISGLVKSTIIWSIVAIISVGTHLITASFPQFIDRFYTGGLFQAIRYIFDFTVGWLPFPTIYLFFLFVLYLLIFRFLKPILKRKTTLLDVGLRILRTAAILISAFYFLWGWNYNQSDIADLMNLPKMRMQESDLETEFAAATEELEKVIATHGDDWDLAYLKNHHYSEAEIRETLEGVLKDFDYPVGGRVRGRLLSPKGTLLVWNTAGIYIPFVGEGHVDKGLLPFQLPSTLAHEMSHGYGITDEGSCNFTAYLTCRRSANPFIQFSGALGYWRYVASEYRRSFPEKFRSNYDSLPQLVIDCLIAIRANDDRYPEWMPNLRYTVYDNYLKAQGIQEGMRNYSRVVQLVSRWRLKESSR